MGRVLHEIGREVGRSDRMRGGGTIYWACTPSTARKMYVYGIGMYVEMGIDVGRAGDKVLLVSTPVGRGEGGHLPAYLALPLIRCTWKDSIMDLINDLIQTLKALQLLVET
jgi:hypothetical protein